MRFFALLEDFDETMAARLALGPEARTMSDQEIVDRWNQHVLALAHGFDDTTLTLARLGHLLRRRGAHICLLCAEP